MNYRADPFGAACLEQAVKSKGSMAFGAVLVQGNRIVGRGWNRRSTPVERSRLRGVDYSIHAEQACVLDALDHHHKATRGRVYVLGYAPAGPNKGQLSVRDSPAFTCRKCPHTLRQYQLTVMIPTPEGWVEMSPIAAMQSAQSHLNHWQNFVAGRTRCPTTT
jgi:hypothetical protein